MTQEYPVRYLDALSVTVPFDEIGEPTEGIDEDGHPYVDRTIMCDWGNRWALAEQMKGTSKLIGGVILMHPGQPAPYLSNVRVASVEIEPFGRMTGTGESGFADFAKAKLRLRYTRPENAGGLGDDDEELLVTETIQPTMEFLTVGTKGLYWDRDQKKPLLNVEAPGQLVRGIDWVYTRHKMMRLPTGVLSLVGHVNSSAIKSNSTGLVFQPEELLYGAPVIERDVTTSGAKAWRVTYRLTYKPGGWNSFHRSGDTAKSRIYDENGEVWRPYPLGDMSILTG